MEFKIKEQEKNIVKVEYICSIDEFKKYTQMAYNKSKSKFVIPGFRKGKAPQKIIELNYGKEVFYDEGLDFFLDEQYPKSLQELKLEPVVRPSFDNVDIDEEKGIKVEVTITQKPEVELGEYKNIKVDKISTEVTEEEVQEQLKSEQDKNARLVTVEGRKSKEGDSLTIDFTGYVDGEEFEGGSAKAHTIIIGSNTFIPGFEEQLVDLEVGDEKDINVVFPEEYQEPLNGKPAVFKIKVIDVKMKELPEINDEFITEISEFDTIEEYKVSKKEELEEQKKKSKEEQIANISISKAIENTNVEIPKEQIEERTKIGIENMEKRMKESGFTIELYLQMTGMDEEAFKKTMEANAVKEVTLEYMLEAIVEKEELSVTKEEVKELLSSFIKEEEELEKITEDNPIYKHFEKEALLEKARKLIIETSEEV